MVPRPKGCHLHDRTALEGACRRHWRTQLHPGAQGPVSALCWRCWRSQSHPLAEHGGVSTKAPHTPQQWEAPRFGSGLLHPHSFRHGTGWARKDRLVGDECIRLMPAAPWTTKTHCPSCPQTFPCPQRRFSHASS